MNKFKTFRENNFKIIKLIMVKNENFNSGPNLGRSNTFKALNGNDQCNVYLKKKKYI